MLHNTTMSPFVTPLVNPDPPSVTEHRQRHPEPSPLRHLRDRLHHTRQDPGASGAAAVVVLTLMLASLPTPAPAAAAAAAAPACPPPQIPVEPLGGGVWRVPGAEGDSQAANRGAISNLLAVRDGKRLWLLGSGPSQRWGRALDCRLQQLAGLAVTDVIAPWARPELVLGQGGMPGARRWAHREVAQAMQERCPGCIERLRLRLGEAASDLNEADIPLPQRPGDRLLEGESGRLGPWHWLRLQRAEGTAVTLWRLDRAQILTGHGLLWGEGAPDLRDSSLVPYRQALDGLAAWATQRPAAQQPGWRWLPEQGPWLPMQALQQHRDYLEGLTRSVSAAIESGAGETDPPGRWPGLPPQFLAGERHGLNWQRSWRELESLSWSAGTAGSTGKAR